MAPEEIKMRNMAVAPTVSLTASRDCTLYPTSTGTKQRLKPPLTPAP